MHPPGTKRSFEVCLKWRKLCGDMRSAADVGGGGVSSAVALGLATCSKLAPNLQDMSASLKSVDSFFFGGDIPSYTTYTYTHFQTFTLLEKHIHLTPSPATYVYVRLQVMQVCKFEN